MLADVCPGNDIEFHLKHNTQDWIKVKVINLDEEYEITKPNGCVIVRKAKENIIPITKTLYFNTQLNKIKNASKIVIKHYITFKSYSDISHKINLDGKVEQVSKFTYRAPQDSSYFCLGDDFFVVNGVDMASNKSDEKSDKGEKNKYNIPKKQENDNTDKNLQSIFDFFDCGLDETTKKNRTKTSDNAVFSIKQDIRLYLEENDSWVDRYIHMDKK